MPKLGETGEGINLHAAQVVLRQAQAGQTSQSFEYTLVDFRHTVHTDINGSKKIEILHYRNIILLRSIMIS